MRRPDEQPLHPEVVASLEAIDATLAGEPVAPRHADLAELSLLLADERPAIDPGFAHALDKRVGARFPDRKDRRPAASGWLQRRWAWLASGAVATAAVAAIVVLIAGSGGGKPIAEDLGVPARSSPAPSSAASSAGSSAASSAGSSAGSSAAGSS